MDNFSYFLNEEYSVQKYFVPPQEKIRFIPGLHASYTLNRANLATIWSGSELSRSERGLLARGGIFQVLVSPFKHYFKDNVFWAKNVYLPILNNTLDKMYVNNDLLHKVLVEGVFGALAEQLLDAADTLLFLDLDWSVCRDSLLLRCSQSARQRDAMAAEENFQKLLVWASEYEQRASKSSRQFHRELFERFPNDKRRFTTRAEVNSYLAQRAAHS